jgi:hypothetical protein
VVPPVVTVAFATVREPILYGVVVASRLAGTGRSSCGFHLGGWSTCA